MFLYLTPQVLNRLALESVPTIAGVRKNPVFGLDDEEMRNWPDRSRETECFVIIQPQIALNQTTDGMTSKRPATLNSRLQRLHVAATLKSSNSGHSLTRNLVQVAGHAARHLEPRTLLESRDECSAPMLYVACPYSVQKVLVSRDSFHSTH